MLAMLPPPDSTCEFSVPSSSKAKQLINQMARFSIHLDFMRGNWTLLLAEIGSFMWLLLGYRHSTLLSLFCLVNLYCQPHGINHVEMSL